MPTHICLESTQLLTDLSTVIVETY